MTPYRLLVPFWMTISMTGCGASRAESERVSPRSARPVRVERVDERWRLLRGGAPFALRGAGAHHRLPLLAESGATSLRTWGVDTDTGALLDEAESLGLAVTLGLWLGHVEHGFDWHDESQLAEQRDRVREAVIAHRDHPALLLWGIGNEMELGNDDPAMWRELGALVRMVEELDPHHPTMVVTAELGAANAARLRSYVPEADIWGINSYGGIHSLSERLDTVGWESPFIVTELGNRGDWETPHTRWGAPGEPNSTQKADEYRNALAAVADDPRCLGTYAFLWGRSETPVDTWHSLLGPGELRYEPSDVLLEAWRGRPPENRAPRNEGLELDSSAGRVNPGEALRAQLRARDPEGDPLQYAWVLHRDSLRGSGAGPFHHCVELGEGGPELEVRAPNTAGPWRLLGVAVDPHGGATYASARFEVAGAAPDATPHPFWVDGPFSPSGWMGDASAQVTMDACPPRDGFCHGPCRRFTYRGDEDAEHGWAAVAWMHPADNWRGRRTGVRVAPGARAVEFTAWGARGGERVTFSVGHGSVDRFERKLEGLELSTAPTLHRIRLDAGVREDVVFGFAWTATDPGPSGMTFHIADIRWVGDEHAEPSDSVDEEER